MKAALTLLFTLALLTGFASKTFTLDIIVTSAYDGLPVEGCLVRMTDSQSGHETEKRTNSEGKVQFEELTTSHYTLLFIERSGLYQKETVTMKNKKKSDQSVDFHLFPNAKFERIIWQLEDSIYGPINKGEVPDSATLDIKDIKSDSLCHDAGFPGGTGKLQAYIIENINYPEYSIDMEEQGRVYLSFVVEPNGAISHVRVDKGVSQHLDRESIRLIRGMPKWDASICNDVPVRTYCMLPIVYTLN